MGIEKTIDRRCAGLEVCADGWGGLLVWTRFVSVGELKFGFSAESLDCIRL